MHNIKVAKTFISAQKRKDKTVLKLRGKNPYADLGDTKILMDYMMFSKLNR